jgi:hypothetical protein
MLEFMRANPLITMKEARKELRISNPRFNKFFRELRRDANVVPLVSVGSNRGNNEKVHRVDGRGRFRARRRRYNRAKNNRGAMLEFMCANPLITMKKARKELRISNPRFNRFFRELKREAHCISLLSVQRSGVNRGSHEKGANGAAVHEGQGPTVFKGMSTVCKKLESAVCTVTASVIPVAIPRTSLLKKLPEPEIRCSGCGVLDADYLFACKLDCSDKPVASLRGHVRLECTCCLVHTKYETEHGA